MPSEWQKWLARNEKPEEERELTPEEKRRNWWHYNKWYVVAAAVALLLVINLAVSTTSGKRNAPDIQIAYIGTRPLPDDTVEALETALAAFAQDITGDGVAKVRIRQYIQRDDIIAPVQIAVDLTAGESRFYLMEDPESFQETYTVLGYADGVFGDGVSRQEPLWYLWSECPVLVDMEPGLPGGQKLLSTLYIGRRGIDESYEHGDVDNAMWDRILAKAE